MKEITTFIVSTLVTTLIIFAVVVRNRSAPTSERMARGFYWISLFLSFALLINTLLSVTGVLPIKGIFLLISRALIYRGSLVIGTGLSSAALILADGFGYLRSRVTTEGVRSFIGSPYLLKGICITVATAFFAVEIGKSNNDAEMRKFFLESGYPVWFLYFTMAAEILGSIGLFISRTIIPAAFGLGVIMLGAIYTHYRNHDPFSDSLEATHLLVLLACIIIISLPRRKVQSRSVLLSQGIDA
jgi:uncharacterized membrane protein YphA (DoxX/SURF4 family)